MHSGVWTWRHCYTVTLLSGLELIKRAFFISLIRRDCISVRQTKVALNLIHTLCSCNLELLAAFLYLFYLLKVQTGAGAALVFPAYKEAFRRGAWGRAETFTHQGHSVSTLHYHWLAMNNTRKGNSQNDTCCISLREYTSVLNPR
jgi:hypothetical protein